MMELLSWVITVLVVALLATFLASLGSLKGIPVGSRPKTRTFDRLGRVIDVEENPDSLGQSKEDRTSEEGENGT